MQAVALIIFLAVNTDDAAIRKEVQRLDGTWKVVAMEAEGKKVAEKDIPFETVVFKRPNSRSLPIVKGSFWNSNAKNVEVL